ncbi:MAG: F0F1 ATP synthase subunit B [Clostridiales bacterium]|jgi:F-type H+-transporting ATPase subunit b|nr:F0F1 ATP synthase subunit B [Eubacteriales bacterium]MDH7566310.1 F0F1 ATP synthase subunit B [Clostridiales bacterium]
MFESLNAFKFLMVALNLLILYFIMKRLLFKRVTDFMENRTNSIKESIDSAERNKAQALEMKQKYEDQLRTARDEADKILNEARGRGNREYDSIVAAAKQEAERVLASAREEIERERAQMLKEIKGQVAGLALAAASKVIEANMNTESNRALVDKFIDEVGAA